MNILTVCALLLVPAAPPSAPPALAPTPAATPAVVVRIGEASLEEYRHGDPGNRLQLERGVQCAGKS